MADVSDASDPWVMCMYRQKPMMHEECGSCGSKQKNIYEGRVYILKEPPY